MAASNETQTVVEPSAQRLRNDEVSELRRIHGDQIKVIKNVGDFEYVIELKQKALDLAVKFQISDTYPTEVPNIILKSKKLSADHHTQLYSHLLAVASASVGTVMLDKLHTSLHTWLSDNNIRIDDLSSDEENTNSPKRKGKKASKCRHNKKPDDDSDEVTNTKKPSMKTAEDVIHRILWDERLPSDDFIVAYMDRFLGVVEKAFAAFSWEDIASVDYNTLAIPKHRIQYFKYRSVKVWEKSTRLDNVFGSTGSGKTIIDVITEEENRSEESQQEWEKVPRDQPRVFASGDDAEDADDDEDDGVVINLVGEVEHDELEEVDDCPVHKRDLYWGHKIRPTHFLALRIVDPEIVKNVRECQDTLLDIEPSYRHDCIIPPERLHVTLCCLGLDTEDQVKTAVHALHKAKEELAEFNPEKIKLELSDIGNFFNTTVYAKVAESPPFMEFVNHIRTIYAEEGISVRDLFEFTPHMTLMKLKKNLAHQLNTRYLNPRAFEFMFGKMFGSQIVDNIHLCSMSEDRRADGFYTCPTAVYFGQDETS